MKARIEFDLNDPDEKEAHRMAINGQGAHLVIAEIDGYLRNAIKYRDAFASAPDELSLVRTRIREICRDFRVEIFE